MDNIYYSYSQSSLAICGFNQENTAEGLISPSKPKTFDHLSLK